MDNVHNKHNQQAQTKILEDVKKYGHHVALLEADNYLPAFAYTIGLFQTYGHPEIICFGLSVSNMHALLNHAAELAKEKSLSSEIILSNKPYADIIEKYEVMFLEVQKAHYADYLGYANWFYKGQQNFPVLQLIWPDQEGLFPWMDKFEQRLQFRQPLLDRNTDFKFYEPRNLAVYTTRQVLQGAPILYVFHDEDGDWQFFETPTPDMDDAKLVSLSALVKQDPTLNEIYYLQYGYEAFREQMTLPWVIRRSLADG